jgi:hypothetical protein
MLVKCVVNTMEEALVWGLQSYGIEERFHYDNNYEFLTLGQVHLVHGVLITSKGIWIFILTDKNDEYPTQYPISFFEVIDSSIPIDWAIGEGSEFNSPLRKVFAFLTYSEWASNRNFYEALVNGESQAVYNFRQMSNQ